MKKQLIYLSPDCFFDTDVLVLQHLAKEYDLTWVALVTAGGSRVNGDAAVEEMARQAGVKLILKKLYWRKFSLQQLSFDIRLLRELKQLRADLVYAEDVGDLFFYLLQPFFLRKKTTVYGIHDVVPHSGRNDLRSKMQALLFGLTRWLLVRWARNFHIFSRTEYLKFRQLYPSKKAFYTRLLLKSFGTPASGPGSIEGHCRLLFFGLIEYYKGLDLLVEAVESLVKEGFGNFSLTIAGRGPYWQQCEALVRSREHYNLNIRYIPDEEIPGLFTGHHFIVLPYRDASQSGPQMISLQYNLPAIASDAEGLSDFVVDEESGFIFSHKPASPSHSLTDRLRRCLTMTDGDYARMRERLMAWKEQHYSPEETIKRYINFFNSGMEDRS